MTRDDLDALARLGPFELKNTLIALAASHGERLMLNAGRVPSGTPPVGLSALPHLGNAAKMNRVTLDFDTKMPGDQRVCRLAEND